MALELFLNSLDGVPGDVAREYIKDGDRYRLDVTGAVPASKLAEFRDNNITLKKQLEAFEGLDPAKAREAVSMYDKYKDKKLVEDGKVEELIAARTDKMKSEYEGQVKSLSENNSVLSRQLEGLLIDSAVRVAAGEVSILNTAVDDVLLRAKSVFKIHEGVATPFNDQGQIIYGKDGVNPMSIKEWMGGLAKTAPHLFQGTTGTGAPRSTGLAGVDTSKLSPTQKILSGLNS